MASENGEFKGEVKAKLDFNDKEHEKLYELIEASETRLLHAIELFDRPFNSLKMKFYFWNGSLTVAVGVGAYLAILLIEHLFKG